MITVTDKVNHEPCSGATANQLAQLKEVLKGPHINLLALQRELHQF